MHLCWQCSCHALVGISAYGKDMHVIQIDCSFGAVHAYVVFKGMPRIPSLACDARTPMCRCMRTHSPTPRQHVVGLWWWLGEGNRHWTSCHSSHSRRRPDHWSCCIGRCGDGTWSHVWQLLCHCMPIAADRGRYLPIKPECPAWQSLCQALAFNLHRRGMLELCFTSVGIDE